MRVLATPGYGVLTISDVKKSKSNVSLQTMPQGLPSDICFINSRYLDLFNSVNVCKLWKFQLLHSGTQSYSYLFNILQVQTAQLPLIFNQILCQ